MLKKYLAALLCLCSSCLAAAPHELSGEHADSLSTLATNSSPKLSLCDAFVRYAEITRGAANDPEMSKDDAFSLSFFYISQSPEYQELSEDRKKAWKEFVRSASDWGYDHSNVDSFQLKGREYCQVNLARADIELTRTVLACQGFSSVVYETYPIYSVVRDAKLIEEVARTSGSFDSEEIRDVSKAASFIDRQYKELGDREAIAAEAYRQCLTKKPSLYNREGR